MAHINIENSEIVVALSAFEKAEAVHGDLHLALAALQNAESIDDPMSGVHGLRSPGTGIPGTVAVGTFRKDGKKLFAVIHHGTPRGVRLSFEGADYDQVIVGCDDPEAVVALLTDATRL
jgi:hypothetical protein